MQYQQVRDYIVIPTLKNLQMWSPSAEVLVLGTIAQESAGGKYLRQIQADGTGISDSEVGAWGICGMERWVHRDQWDNWLKYRPDRIDMIYDLFGCSTCPPDDWITCNLSYSVAMCRIMYWRVPKPLPVSTNLFGLGEYWDEHYNKNPNHGTADQWVKSYLNWRK